MATKRPRRPGCAKSKTAEKSTRNAVVRFVLNGEYPEAASDESLFGEMQPSLSKLIDRLNEAKADKEVKAVWLRIEDVELGRGKVNELRRGDCRGPQGGQAGLCRDGLSRHRAVPRRRGLRSICMPSSGDLALPGVRLEMTFYKGLLDKLGLKFDMLAHG